MRNDDNILLTLLLVFMPLSLSALGGGVSVISSMQHQAVEVYKWTTGAEFLALFAISRGAPGPGSMMLTTLIGWKVAGIAGALVATFAMFAPSSALCVATAAVWRRFRGRRFMTVIETALAPIGVGLLVGGVSSLAELVSTSWGLTAIAITSCAACLVFPRTHPLLVIGAGAVFNLGFLMLR